MIESKAYIPNIKVKPIRLEIPEKNDLPVHWCLVNYQWPQEGFNFTTAMIDCSKVESCVICNIQIKNVNLDYLVDNGYIDKAQALELTLAGGR